MEKKRGKKKGEEEKIEKDEKENIEEKKEEKKEEVCEIFDVEKDGKEETIRSCGVEEEKIVSKDQVKKENKLLRNIFLLMIGFCLMFLVGYFLIESSKHINYEGVKFDFVKEGQLRLYRTSIPGKIDNNGTFVPGIYKGAANQANYRIWLRKDPRALDIIPFEGCLDLKTNMVINMSQDFNCDGDGVIAIANLLKLYNEALGINVMKDENASCDPQGKYMFVNIREGDKTYIEEPGNACYTLYIKDCEILEGVERFMLETFVEVNIELK